MIKLFDNDNEQEIGVISETQLEFIQEQLIEETIDANTFNIDQSALASLEANGADREVVALMRAALGSRHSMEFRFETD